MNLLCDVQLLVTYSLVLYIEKNNSFISGCKCLPEDKLCKTGETVHFCSQLRRILMSQGVCAVHSTVNQHVSSQPVSANILLWLTEPSLVSGEHYCYWTMDVFSCPLIQFIWLKASPASAHSTTNYRHPAWLNILQSNSRNTLTSVNPLYILLLKLASRIIYKIMCNFMIFKNNLTCNLTYNM